MKFKDIVELSFQRFRTRSLRFLLTVFGVGVGIGVVFLLVTLGFGLQELVIGRISSSESLLSLDVAVSEDTAKILPITNATVDEFKKIPGVTDVSPLLSSPVELNYGTIKAQSLAQAVNPAYFRYAGISASVGKLFDEEKDGIVVSKTVLRLFDLQPQDALNKEVNLTLFLPKQTQIVSEEKKPSIAGKSTTPTPTPNTDNEINIVALPVPFKIVGILDDEANSIYIPLSAVGISDLTYAQTKVRVQTKESINPVREALLAKGFTVKALTDTLDQLNQIFRATQASLGVLGIVALFIASVGMFNTLTISLLERTREVGILKTIGATHRDIWMIFLFEAELIGALGGISGVLGGIIFSKVVNILVNGMAQRFGGQSVNLFLAPWWFIFTIIIVSLFVGFLTGVYPAKRAAKISPLEALKRE